MRPSAIATDASQLPNRSVTDLLQPLCEASLDPTHKVYVYDTRLCLPALRCYLSAFTSRVAQSFAVGVAQRRRRGIRAARQQNMDAPSPVEGELVAVIERTRAVAERWKALHLREEGMCAELRQLVRKSARSVDSAREMRDKAVEVQKAAQQDAVAAKHEKARWRARADAQSNAKVFLEADRLRGEPSPLPQP